MPPTHDDCLGEARQRYFRANGLGEDGGYNAAWVPLAFGPIRFAIPNTPGRVRAVRYHDLHHVLTGYATDWVGEGEIGAWEVASSCRDFWAAWILNLYAMHVGLWIAPRRIWCAFQRGRHCRNLYGEDLDRSWISASLADAGTRLGLEHAAPRADSGDVAAFAGWILTAVALVLATAAITLGPFVAIGWWLTT